jgi:hypothetical protein
MMVRVAISLALVAAGCSGRSREPARESVGISVLEARVDTGLELRVVLPRDTIQTRDRERIEVLTLIVNGPRATRFNNDPGRFGYGIETIDGRPVRPDRFTYPPTGANGETGLLLPARAVLVQTRDLRSWTSTAMWRCTRSLTSTWGAGSCARRVPTA